MSSDRSCHRLAVSDPSQKEFWKRFCERAFGGGVEFLSSFHTFAFNNSNPLLHPARMAVLFRDWQSRVYPENPPFYAGWTDESSELYIAADKEMGLILKKLDDGGACESDYESVLTHYGVATAKKLTEKIHSIESFRKILSPMILRNGVWKPDFTSRYFVEDVDIGLAEIIARGHLSGVSVPVLEGLWTAMIDVRKCGGVETR